jgi:transcriptional regulator with XRE-family HTH domain
MEDRELIKKLKELKEEKGYTLYELSQRLDIQVSTLERWFRTGRINRVYAWYIREKLRLTL